MQVAICLEPLNGCDLRPLGLQCRIGARGDGFSVEDNGAGATLALAAPDLGPDQAQLVRKTSASISSGSTSTVTFRPFRVITSSGMRSSSLRPRPGLTPATRHGAPGPRPWPSDILWNHAHSCLVAGRLPLPVPPRLRSSRAKQPGLSVSLQPGRREKALWPLGLSRSRLVKAPSSNAATTATLIMGRARERRWARRL